MSGRAPRTSQVLVAVAFAFSCFGLLLFLWTTFGGPVPFAPEGYRVKIPFTEGTQLAVESDVRISNVSVGKVKKIDLQTSGPDTGTALATVEIDSPYAPLPADTRAILRQKTLLGETYVELTPGNGSGPKLAEGATLPRAQVSSAVQLDEIFRTFNARTRAAFQSWMQNAAVALNGRGADLNAAFGNLEPFAADANRLLRILDSQSGAVRGLVRNSGAVFQALSQRRGQLASLIRNSNTVFSTTARRDQDLEQLFVALPTFERQSRQTLTRLNTFAQTTDPLIQQLRPAAVQLSGALRQTARLAPELEGFFRGFRRVAKNSKRGLPALDDLINNQIPPLLAELHPFTRDLTPILEAATQYKHELTGFLGNVAAASNASQTATAGGSVKVLRTSSALNPEGLASYPGGVGRLQMDRPNPYFAPLGLNGVKSGLFAYETRQCTTGANATITNGGPNPLNADTFNRVKLYAFANQTSTPTVPTLPCKQQGKFQSIGAIPELTQYQHVSALAP
jgi:phospholipid/cholesterol/gamma-HCH transport system substrate-binding protein